MSRFRLILVWFVMAAFPLQGFAAASMLFCGMGAHPAAVQLPSQAPAEHDHTQHSHGKHSHADEVRAVEVAHDIGKQPPDAGHKCGVCAACCYGVALVEFTHVPVAAPVPQAVLVEPVVLIHARASPVPDKPPRA